MVLNYAVSNGWSVRNQAMQIRHNLWRTPCKTCLLRPFTGELEEITV